MEGGVYSYKNLPFPGARVFEDTADVASYSYDPVKRELVSYDVPDIVQLKADYVKSKSLGGCMFWEVCARVTFGAFSNSEHDLLAFDGQDGAEFARSDCWCGPWSVGSDAGESSDTLPMPVICNTISLFFFSSSYRTTYSGSRICDAWMTCSMA